MFDNLKDKLGSFRTKATEAAEENVEEVDETDLEEADLDTSDLDESTDTDLDDRTDDVSTDRADGADGPDVDATAADVDAAAGSTGARTVSESERSTPNEAERTAESLGSVSSGEPDTGDVDSLASDDDAVDDTSETAAESSEAETDEETNSTGFGRKAKSLIRGKFVIEAEDLEGPLQELELALLSSDVELTVAEEIIDRIRDELVGETRTFTTSTGSVVEEALADAIHDVISVGQFDFDERVAEADKPLTIIFTGVNGVGKTTSIAKLDRYFTERGYSTVMANGDTYRAGANEQIREHAEARGTKLISHDQGGDPAAVLYDAVEYADANDTDVVLGDTAGRLHTDEGLMDQLEKIGRVVDPDMTLFVDEAVAGQDAVNRAREFNEAVEMDGAILTKADADSNGGAAISIAHVTGKPILFLGVGQEYDDIERFDPDEMVDRLLAEE